MSEVAADFYRQQFGLTGDALSLFVNPVSVNILADNPRGIDVHTWLDNAKAQWDISFGMHTHVEHNTSAALLAMKQEGVIDPDDSRMNNDAVGMPIMEALEFGDRLARAMVNKQVATGKLRTMVMETVIEDQLPTTVINKLTAARNQAAGLPGGPRDIGGFDTWYRVLGTARVGGYVGTLACGILARPRVLPADATATDSLHHVVPHLRFAPYPRREVTIGLLDEANRLAAQTTASIQHINPHRG